MGLRWMVFLQCSAFLEVFMALAVMFRSKWRPLAPEPSFAPASRQRCFFPPTGNERPEPSAPDTFRQSPPGIDARRAIKPEKCPSFVGSTFSCPGPSTSLPTRSASNPVRYHPFEVQYEISLFLQLQPGRTPWLPPAWRPKRQACFRAPEPRESPRVFSLAEDPFDLHRPEAGPHPRKAGRPARAESKRLQFLAG